MSGKRFEKKPVIQGLLKANSMYRNDTLFKKICMASGSLEYDSFFFDFVNQKPIRFDIALYV